MPDISITNLTLPVALILSTAWIVVSNVNFVLAILYFFAGMIFVFLFQETEHKHDLKVRGLRW